MTRKTAQELTRYYLTSHGAECDGDDGNWFDFTFREYRFVLGVYHDIIDIRPNSGRYIRVNLPYCNVDAADPEFDPEIFFKPLFVGLKKHMKEYIPT